MRPDGARRGEDARIRVRVGVGGSAPARLPCLRAALAAGCWVTAPCSSLALSLQCSVTRRVCLTPLVRLCICKIRRRCQWLRPVLRALGVVLPGWRVASTAGCCQLTWCVAGLPEGQAFQYCEIHGRSVSGALTICWASVHALCHFMLAVASGYSCRPHFTDGEFEAQRGK